MLLEENPGSDGCTGFFESWFGISWQSCCVQHDWDWWVLTTVIDFIKSNILFVQCLATYDVFAATCMAVVVCSPIGMYYYFLGEKKINPKP